MEQGTNTITQHRGGETHRAIYSAGYQKIAQKITKTLDYYLTQFVTDETLWYSNFYINLLGPGVSLTGDRMGDSLSSKLDFLKPSYFTLASVVQDLSSWKFKGSYSWLKGKGLSWSWREGGEGESSGHKQVNSMPRIIL